MTARLLDGKSLALSFLDTIRTRVSTHVASGKRPPCLAVILAGDDPASAIYVRNKQQACHEAGISSKSHLLPASVDQKTLSALIRELNENSSVDGILLQLPLPPHLDADDLLEIIHPKKDVDGFHPYNLGRLLQRRPLLRPCTPLGIMKLLSHNGISCRESHAVIIGASNIVGRPMACELLMAGATVTVCHRFTGNLTPFVTTADILVSAVGKPGLVRSEWIKPGAVVIDVGFTRLPNGSLQGDVEFEAARSRAAWITPVPGGVGPMTVAMLLENTLMAAAVPE